MVTVSRDDVTVAAECAVCHRDLSPNEESVVVVSVPTMTSHMLCQEDWTVIIVSAYAALHRDGDDSPNAVRDRIYAAYDDFFAEND